MYEHKLYIQFVYLAAGGFARDILVQQAVVDTSDSYQTCGSIEGVVEVFRVLTAINQGQQDLLKLLQHTMHGCMKSRS